MKTYTAESGYIYHYFYEGRRAVGRRGGETEFVFNVSADRRTWQRVAIRLSEEAVVSWQTARLRELSANERYAITKMALFQAFDERAEPAQLRGAIHIREADIAAIAATLGFE
jgi:hypothetical protein